MGVHAVERGLEFVRPARNVDDAGSGLDLHHGPHATPPGFLPHGLAGALAGLGTVAAPGPVAAALGAGAPRGNWPISPAERPFNSSSGATPLRIGILMGALLLARPARRRAGGTASASPTRKSSPT